MHGVRRSGAELLRPAGGEGVWDSRRISSTRTWSPTCDCAAAEPVPAMVLDPFAGAGTTGLVADRLGREAILIELNPDYARMAEQRIQDDAPLLVDAQVAPAALTGCAGAS